MSFIKFTAEYLTKNPTIGMVSGVISSVFFNIQSFVTNEEFGKVAAGFGLYLGLAIACLTFILKLIEFFQKLKILEMLYKIKKITFKNKKQKHGRF